MEKYRFWCTQCKQILTEDGVELREVDTMFSDGRWWFCHTCGASLICYPVGGGQPPTGEEDFLAHDLSVLLVGLGEPALSSYWSCHMVEAYGSNADDLHFYSDHDQRITGQNLLGIVAVLDNIVDGRFSAFYPDEPRPWLVVVAIDNRIYEIESLDPVVGHFRRQGWDKPQRPAFWRAPAPSRVEAGGELPSPPVLYPAPEDPGYLTGVTAYASLVETALTDFASQSWGRSDSWEYQARPVYRSTVRDYFNGRVIGAISKRFPEPVAHPDTISSDRVCVSLQGDAAAEHRLRVFAFQDFGYFQLDHGKISTNASFTHYRASYLCLGIVHLDTDLAYPALLNGIRELYEYLEHSPVDLVTEGYENPEFVEKELRPGLWFTISLWGKHT